MAERVKFLTDALLLCYSQIFFSSRKPVGILFMLATFVHPGHGLFGVIGALFSIASAYLIGIDPKFIRQGLYGYNAVLLGLGFGFFYKIGVENLLFLLVSIILLTFLTFFLNNLFQQYFGLPALTLPFTLMMWLVLLSGQRLEGLRQHPFGWGDLFTGVAPLAGVFPYPWDTFLSSFSAILFQANPLSGCMIALGVLIYSRIAVVLMTAGFFLALFLHHHLGTDLVAFQHLGFNYMFAALAIGGIFTVPNPASLGFALLAVAITVVILVGSTAFSSPLFSPWTLPFNLAVWLVLYSLRTGKCPIGEIHLVEYGDGSPEENLKKQREDRMVWRRRNRVITLPFHGRWKVTQGIDGKYTHQDVWRFAYDFQAVDSYGHASHHEGTDLVHYYAYGLPTLAPADGKVHAVKGDIPDNSIGSVNTDENWGNHVIIEHGPDHYSCLCHLKQDSIRVTPGQEVFRGETIAACGNSGRSPYPHIHLQFQKRPEIGAPTASFDFSQIVLSDQEETLLLQGQLKEGDIVVNMKPAVGHEMFFPYALNKVYSYEWNSGNSAKEGLKRSEIELWRMEVDFDGHTMLISSPSVTRLTFHLSDGVLTATGVAGDRDTGLFLFGSLLSRIPLIQGNKAIKWSSSIGPDISPKRIYESFLDPFSLLGVGLLQSKACVMKPSEDELILHVRPSTQLSVPFLTLPLMQGEAAEIRFKRNVGLVKMTVGNKMLRVYENSR